MSSPSPPPSSSRYAAAALLRLLPEGALASSSKTAQRAGRGIAVSEPGQEEAVELLAECVLPTGPLPEVFQDAAERKLGPLAITNPWRAILDLELQRWDKQAADYPAQALGLAVCAKSYAFVMATELGVRMAAWERLFGPAPRPLCLSAGEILLCAMRAYNVDDGTFIRQIFCAEDSKLRKWRSGARQPKWSEICAIEERVAKLLDPRRASYVRSAMVIAVMLGKAAREQDALMRELAVRVVRIRKTTHEVFSKLRTTRPVEYIADYVVSGKPALVGTLLHCELEKAPGLEDMHEELKLHRSGPEQCAVVHVGERRFGTTALPARSQRHQTAEGRMIDAYCLAALRGDSDQTVQELRGEALRFIEAEIGVGPRNWVLYAQAHFLRESLGIRPPKEYAKHVLDLSGRKLTDDLRCVAYTSPAPNPKRGIV